jgi:hypothetical protein
VAVKFAELLDANRVRPLWRHEQSATASGPPAPLRTADDPSSAAVSGDGTHGLSAPTRPGEPLDPQSAPLQPLPRETPLEILDKTTQLLGILLGPQAILLDIYLQPLRLALALREGALVQPHPLQEALHSGNLPLLIYQLEDSIRALLRLQQRVSR